MASRATKTGAVGVGAATVSGILEFVMTAGTVGWIPLVSGVVGAGIAFGIDSLVEHRKNSSPGLISLGISAGPAVPHQEKTPSPPPPKPAHEIPGARAWNFALYQLACLLVAETTTWPLQSQKTRDEFNSICRYADGVPGLGEEIGYNTDDFPPDITDYTQASGTIYKVRITRVQARQYLHSQGRSIPEFLDERFDATCKPKGDTW